MSKKGRILGAIIGLFVMGPIGAAIGFFAGWYFIDKKENQQRNSINEAREAFRYSQGKNNELLYGLFMLLGYIARGAGAIQKEAILQAQQYMDMLRMNDSASRSRAQQAFNRGKAADFNLNEEIISIRHSCMENINIVSIVLELLVQMALADGRISEEEYRRLLEVANGLGVPKELIDRMIQMRIAEMQFRQGFYQYRQQGNGYYQGGNSQYDQDSSDGYAGGQSQQQTSASQLEEAYKIIGVSPDASWEEVRKAHKKLMLKYHPDRLKSQGIPDEMIASYAEKAKDIQAAFDCIKRARGEKN